MFELLVRPEGPLHAWDSERAVVAAVRHGLAGLVLAQLPKTLMTFSDAQRATLERESRAVAQQALRSHALLLRCLDAFGEAGITPVVLKGPVLAARTWPEPLLRPCADVDLLVREEELERAKGLLRGLGLELQPGTSDHAGEDEHHVVFVNATGGMVELHHRPLAGLGTSLEWSHLQAPREVAWEGKTVRVLSPEDELLYLSVHAANHLFRRLSWLWDLVLYTRAFPALDWDRVAALAKQTRLTTPAWAALESAGRVFGLGLSVSVMLPLAPPRAVQGLLRRAFTLEKLEASAWADDRLGSGVLRMLMAPGPAEAARFAASRVRRG
jgi:hypothetical protein